MNEIKEELKVTIPSLMVHELIHEFETFVGALKEGYTFSGDSTEKRQDFLRHATAAQNRLQTHFTKAAKSFGLTYDQFCELIGDANHFEPKDWKALQETKERLAKGDSGKASSQKMKKNVKI